MMRLLVLMALFFAMSALVELTAQDAASIEDRSSPKKEPFRVNNTKAEICRIRIANGKMLDDCQNLGKRLCGEGSPESKTRLISRGEYVAVSITPTHADVMPEFFVCVISE